MGFFKRITKRHKKQDTEKSHSFLAQCPTCGYKLTKRDTNGRKLRQK